MSSQKTGLRVASIVFALFAIGHVLRLINHAQVTVGTHAIPMGVSWVALIVAAILSIWLWWLASPR
jgi:hypothetical protein